MSGKIGVTAEGLAETIMEIANGTQYPHGQNMHSSAYPQNKPKMDDQEAVGSCPNKNPRSLAQLQGLI